MNPNKLFRIFLAFIATCVVIYTSLTLSDVYHYAVLNAQAPAHDFHWVVKKRKGDDYRIHGIYLFYIDSQKVKGESAIESEKFLNPWAAKQAISRYQNRAWEVWYNPRNLHDSALQKYFPTKECISTVVLWGILLYFIWLGYYVNQHGRSRS